MEDHFATPPTGGQSSPFSLPERITRIEVILDRLVQDSEKLSQELQQVCKALYGEVHCPGIDTSLALLENDLKKCGEDIRSLQTELPEILVDRLWRSCQKIFIAWLKEHLVQVTITAFLTVLTALFTFWR